MRNLIVTLNLRMSPGCGESADQIADPAMKINFLRYSYFAFAGF